MKLEGLNGTPRVGEFGAQQAAALDWAVPGRRELARLHFAFFALNFT